MCQFKRGIIVKNLAYAASLVLALACAGPASAIDVVNNPQGAQLTTMPRTPDLAAVHTAVLLPTHQSSELPEPEVFLMMLVGLVLIGYRASRVSDEKFK